MQLYENQKFIFNMNSLYKHDWLTLGFTGLFFILLDSRNELLHDRTHKMTIMSREDSADQGHPPNLASRCVHSMVS